MIMKMIIIRGAVCSVSASALHDRVLSRNTRTGQGYVWRKKPGSQHWILCISRDSDDHVNVGPVSYNWGRKRTIDNDIHPMF